MKRIFSKLNLLRGALLAGMVAVILLIIPRPDHQSFSYELSQPWKYPLLTAPFDMPIMRDSASINALRDSVDRAFVPFVKRDDSIGSEAAGRLARIAAGAGMAREGAVLARLLEQAYRTGIVDQKLYDLIRNQGHGRLRMTGAGGDSNTAVSIDASGMMSPAAAYRRIDSLYRQAEGEDARMGEQVGQALGRALTPNVTLDSAADSKYRSQEYLNVTGAQGVIKKGQRIVDRGEIVTPQIYTNLNTYQEILDREQSAGGGQTYFITGQALYVFVCLGLLYLFMALYRRRFFASLRKMTFLTVFITLFVIFAIITFEYVSSGIYLVPFAAVPVIILIFFDSRTAIFALGVAVMISALVATFPFQYVFMELCVGLVATFSIHHLSRRSQLLRTAIVTFLTYCACYFVTCLITEGDLSNFQWRIIGIFAINSVILSFAYILIVIIEKVFGFTSTMTLVELSDINNPLLRRLSEEAPGTFQHSMQVSTLAAEAARAIGANTQLVRTGALYHDIGKLKSPIFFTENQHGVNPHAGLNPETSAHRIISHVADGLELARAEKLPQVIRDFISEHHGRGMAKYFYNTAVNENGGNPVDKTPFTYPGPNPQSKETAILMMADSVEAASRSLPDRSPQAIDTLVDRIIDTQIADGLLKDSPISFKDVATVKETFKKRLATIYHSRVAYPEIHRQGGDAPAAATRTGSRSGKPATPEPAPKPAEPAAAHTAGGDAPPVSGTGLPEGELPNDE